MDNGSDSQDTEYLETPGPLQFLQGTGGMPKILMDTPTSQLEVYPHGAHITHYVNKGKPPVLFLSGASHFEKGKPIRGGIPMIFPWFGDKEGETAHGYARTTNWDMLDTCNPTDDSVELTFGMSTNPQRRKSPPFDLRYSILLSDKLSLRVRVENQSQSEELNYELCLHSYFAVSDINATQVSGLQGVSYLDKLKDFAECKEEGETIRFDSEVDRIYQDTPHPIEIHDEGHNRKLLVEKTGGLTTVIWNPWIEKAKRMPDYHDNDYLNMVCVESGCVGKNKVTLAPGESSTLGVVISQI